MDQFNNQRRQRKEKGGDETAEKPKAPKNAQPANEETKDREGPKRRRPKRRPKTSRPEGAEGQKIDQQTQQANSGEQKQ